MGKVFAVALFGGREVVGATPGPSFIRVAKSPWKQWPVMLNIQIRNASETISAISALI